MNILVTGTILLVVATLGSARKTCYEGEVCYKQLKNTYTPFGKLMEGVHGIAECKAACGNANCGMFDYNVGSRECFTHPHPTVGHDLTYRPGVDQYRIAKCPSQCYGATHASYTPNGTKFNCISGLYNCKRACDQSPDCAAFDFNENTKECFAHKTGYQSHAHPWVTQYEKVIC